MQIQLGFLYFHLLNQPTRFQAERTARAQVLRKECAKGKQRPVWLGHCKGGDGWGMQALQGLAGGHCEVVALTWTKGGAAIGFGAEGTGAAPLVNRIILAAVAGHGGKQGDLLVTSGKGPVCAERWVVRIP